MRRNGKIQEKFGCYKIKEGIKYKYDKNARKNRTKWLRKIFLMSIINNMEGKREHTGNIRLL